MLSMKKDKKDGDINEEEVIDFINDRSCSL